VEHLVKLVLVRMNLGCLLRSRYWGVPRGTCAKPFRMDMFLDVYLGLDIGVFHVDAKLVSGRPLYCLF